MDEKPNKYINLPIPTYEEATSSRPASSQSRVGPEEASDDAERQGLLGHGARNTTATGRGNYAPPTVESGRPSLDSLDGLDAGSEDGELRREIQEMEMEDPNSDNGSHRSILTYRFKRFTNFKNSFPSIRLPSFRSLLPSIKWPDIDWSSMETSRFVIFGRLFGVAVIMGMVYVLVASDLLTLGRNGMAGQRYPPAEVRAYVQAAFRDPTHIGRHLKHVTEYPHMAGSEGSYVLGEYISEIFKESGLEDVNMEKFEVYLNYPRKDGRRVAIVEPDSQKWEAQIEEDHEETLVFHGHSKSGDVTGPLIYANYGSLQDFQELKDKGISVVGAVVLVRYYGTQPDRALKVKAAELAGAVGCIIYSDPVNEGYGKVADLPGRLLPEDGVQRGAVSLMSWVVGDVLSPGWASTPGEKRRLRPDESAGLVKIPSIPLSWRDARHLLGSLRGHGKKMEGSWAGVPETEYWTGDQHSPKVNLKNIQDEAVRQPIYNVIGRIKGWEQSEKKIIIGNHRDAWCFGGADPGSGTAIMLHMVRVFGDLLRENWRPLRTIEFASWDGEEYNLIGSTEHVENRQEDLRRNGIAYLNVDVGATGMDFSASSSPVFNGPLRTALGRVSDPSSNKTLREVWDDKRKQTTSLGAGSDYVAFQDIVGTSSIDMSFSGDAPYPYHSCYDNYDWMERYGDPSWEYSAALGQIWALLVLDFADSALLPMDIRGYATNLDKYIDDLEVDIGKHLSGGTSVGADLMKTPTGTLDFLSLRSAVEAVKARAHDIEVFDDYWTNIVYGSGGFESSLVTVKRVDRNNRVSRFDTNLLDLTEGGGLVNRTQFKHVIFAPQTWSGYDGETFPSIRQWVNVEDWQKVQDEIYKVAGMIEHAARELAV